MYFFIIWSPHLIVIIRLDPLTEMCLPRKIKCWLVSPIYSFLHSFLPSFLPRNVRRHFLASYLWLQRLRVQSGVKPEQRLHLINLETHPPAITSPAPAYSSPYLPPPPPHPTRKLVHWVRNLIIWTLSIESFFGFVLLFFHPGLLISGSSTHLCTLVWSRQYSHRFLSFPVKNKLSTMVILP